MNLTLSEPAPPLIVTAVVPEITNHVNSATGRQLARQLSPSKSSMRTHSPEELHEAFPESTYGATWNSSPCGTGAGTTSAPPFTVIETDCITPVGSIPV